MPRRVNRALKTVTVTDQRALVSEMTSLWAESARLWVDASTTIAWRMPFLRFDDISPATLAERQQMVAEKVEAVGQAQMAAGIAAVKMIGLAMRGTSASETARQASRSVRAVMKPAAKKARSNADRLTETARRRHRPE
jgi:hypothetical protein